MYNATPMYNVHPRFCAHYTRDADSGPRGPCVVAAGTNSHGLQKSCGEKDGMATLWVRQGVRARESPREGPTPAWTGFYCLSGYITSRMALIYYAQVHCRWLPFTDNKGKNVANYFQEEDVADEGEKWLNGLHSILGRFSTNFWKLF